MALLSFSEVTKFYGRQDVLTGVTMAVNPGERIGLVGRNGAGKTTLIRMIMDQERPDDGSITRAKGLRIGYLPQDLLAFTDQTLLSLVMDTAKDLNDIEAELQLVNDELAEKAQWPESPEKRADLEELALRQGQLMHLFESLGGWSKEAEAKKILSGLGFLESDFERQIHEFSGGWIMRGVLARLLLAEPDILVLDEPTNHLDLDSLIWLETYLRTTQSALLLVSHDRVFLNNVCLKIVELSQGKANGYQGNYDQYLLEKDKRLATDQAAFENQQDRIRQMEKFIERNRVRASTARRAQSRMKSLDKMDRLKAPESAGPASFNFSLPQPGRGPEIVAELSNVTKSFGELTVYTDLNLRLRRGERLALVGPNGRGKSTLAKMMMGLEPPSSGQAGLGPNVVVGYFAQFQMENLHPGHTILDELGTVAGDLSQGALRSVLGAFLFSGDEVFKKVSVLSGGEKARLVLAKIMLTAPNLLILDEPTNHLDIQGRQMLEEALSAFTGSICLISHDRHLINVLATEVGIIEDGKLTVYPGNFDDYQNMWQKKAAEAEDQNEAALQGPAAKNDDDGKTVSASERAARRKAEAEARQALSARKKPLMEKIRKLEARLEELNKKQKNLTELMALPETYQDSGKAQELTKEFGQVKEELSQVESNWEAAMLSLEALEPSA